MNGFDFTTLTANYTNYANLCIVVICLIRLIRLLGANYANCLENSYYSFNSPFYHIHR